MSLQAGTSLNSDEMRIGKETLLSYVLITPARNEAKSIALTIEAVIAQTALPVRWVIVSDGSTDGTDEIVQKYSARYEWIELLKMPERRERSFAGKVQAFKAGEERVKDLNYQVIASLDADVSFDKDYFEYLLRHLKNDSRLGLVGTPFQEGDRQVYDYRFVNIEHVSGQCQVFRRECFEDIGGYVPVHAGGIDYIAVLTARMRGWKTRTFTDKVYIHHRQMGTAERGVLGARFKYGIKDYNFGNHPVWELFRVFYQMMQSPVIIGGLALGFGYLLAAIQRAPRPVSDELVSFNRREQLHRLKSVFRKFLKSKNV